MSLLVKWSQLVKELDLIKKEEIDEEVKENVKERLDQEAE
jgi:hypothetical protein